MLLQIVSGQNVTQLDVVVVGRVVDVNVIIADVDHDGDASIFSGIFIISYRGSSKNFVSDSINNGHRA